MWTDAEAEILPSIPFLSALILHSEVLEGWRPSQLSRVEGKVTPRTSFSRRHATIYTYSQLRGANHCTTLFFLNVTLRYEVHIKNVDET